MSRAVRVLALLLSIAVVLSVVLLGSQRRLLYIRSGPPPPVEQVLPGGVAVELATVDGLTLDAWWLPGGSTAVVVLSGNAGNRAGRVPLARDLAGLGLSVLLVEYRGYGGNPGSPTEEGLLADGTAALGWATTRDGIESVVLFGESLGAGVAVGVAAGYTADAGPAALVLRSPFTSVVDVARTHFCPVPGFLVLDRFPSEDRVADLDVPVLVLATGADEVVPFDQSRRLAEAAGAELVRVNANGHNDPALLHGAEVVDAVEEFLRRERLLSSD